MRASAREPRGSIAPRGRTARCSAAARSGRRARGAAATCPGGVTSRTPPGGYAHTGASRGGQRRACAVCGASPFGRAPNRVGRRALPLRRRLLTRRRRLRLSRRRRLACSAERLLRRNRSRDPLARQV
eukprot:4162142-Prymnesium_polylepis.1